MKPRLLTRLFAGGTLAGLVLAFCAMQPVARAQTTGVNVSLPTLVTTASAGTSGTLALDGKYSNCTITTETSTSTATVTVNGNYVTGQYGPAAPYLANSNFGTSGAITATTTTAYTAGNVANLPIGLFYTWSGNSGTLTVQAVCSSAIAKAASGSAGPSGAPGPSGPAGPSGPPGPTICPSGSTYIAVSQAGGGCVILFSPSPSPQIAATACGQNPALTGSWPNETFEIPTCAAAAAPSFSASPPIAVATPPGQVNTSIMLGACMGVDGSGNLVLTCQPACDVVGAACHVNNYRALVLSEPSATHFWEFGDKPNGCASNCTPGPCPSTIADQISGGATAVPSPVSLQTFATPFSTSAPAIPGLPYPVNCGVPGVLPDGYTAADIVYSAAAQNVSAGFSMVSTVMQTLCTPDHASGTNACDSPWTLECIVEGTGGGNGGALQALFAIDTNAAGDFAIYNGQNGGQPGAWQAFIEGSSAGIGGAGAFPQMVDVESNGSGGAVDIMFYFNGALSYTGDTPPRMLATSLSFIGWDGATSGRQFSGRIEDCSTYNTALTWEDLWVHFLATGLR